jgi:asparagine synthase (glutamine-hydrolysing)
LRADLIARGHGFETNSDTETLVHLYEQEGPDGLKRLRGMFAFAIWDSRRRRLFLARDRFGKKPLYYAVLPEGLYFGSELECLREAGVPLDMDREALRLYFQFNYIPDPRTAFRAVRKLPAGGWLEYSQDGTLREGIYWKLPAPASEPPPGLTESAARLKLRDQFDEAVRIRMLADVPLGAFLSGGIDSSSVVASMALQSPEPVKTFSIGFEEAACNELPYASLVARKYGTDHHEILVRPDSWCRSWCGTSVSRSATIPQSLRSWFPNSPCSTLRWRSAAMAATSCLPGTGVLPLWTACAVMIACPSRFAGSWPGRRNSCPTRHTARTTCA